MSLKDRSAALKQKHKQATRDQAAMLLAYESETGTPAERVGEFLVWRACRNDPDMRPRVLRGLLDEIERQRKEAQS